MRSRWIVLLGAALLAVMSGPALPQRSGGTLVVAVDQAPVGLDPHIVTAFSSFRLIDLIYEPLLEFDPDLVLRPALAESVRQLDDRTYVFNLRRGVRFHHGRLLRPDDVVFSFERVLDPATGSPQASRVNLINRVVVTGPDQVTFLLKEPFAPFLSNIPTIRIVPRDVVEANGNLQNVAVGTGPFRLVGEVPDTLFRLDANRDYYRPGQPVVDSIDFRIIPEAGTRVVGLETGQFDLVPDLDPASVQVLRGQRNVQLAGVQELSYSLLGLNLAFPPFSDLRVLRAVDLALDRDELVDAVYFGDAVPGGPLSPALTQWALPVGEYPTYTPNLERARALLAEAGFSGGFDVTLKTFNDLRVAQDVAIVAKAQLERVGIRVNILELPRGEFIQAFRNKDFEMFSSINGGQPDPDGYFFRTFSTGGATNVYNFSDLEVDDLLTRGRTTAEFAGRKAIYDLAQRILVDRGPIKHLAYQTLFTGLAPQVEGFRPHPTRNLSFLREVSVR